MSKRLEHCKMKVKKRKYLIKKTNKYIKHDRFKKLKALILDNDIHPDSVIGRCDRTCLHISAKNGSMDCLKFLIESGADPKLKDTKGNYPLHLSLKYLLRQKSFNRTTAKDLIEPLKQNMAELIHDQNDSGTTCWHLLQGLDAKERLLTEDTSDSNISSESAANCITQDNEWNEKLMEAHEEDHFFSMGKYDNHTFYNKYKENYDEWADRIYQEFRNRQKKHVTHNKKEDVRNSKTSEFRKAPLPPFKPLYLSSDTKEIEKYKRLFDYKNMITKCDMPFSEKSNAEQIISLILKCSDDQDQRKSLREAIRKWHPDKFSQMFTDRIEKSDIDDVMSIVTYVSQTLLTYGK